MFRRGRFTRIVFKWLAPTVGLVALGLALFFYFHTPAPKSYRLRATAGSELGMRHQLGVRLQKEAAGRQLTVELIPCAGSEEALDWVNTRRVDVALIQGALSSADRDNVRQVSTLHVEPLHLLVKKELLADVSASLTALRGKTIEVDEIGSGTHSLATSILEFVGLLSRDQDPAGGYIPQTLGREHLLSETDVRRLPDAVFLVSSLPSATISHLVHAHGYRLVPLPFAEAFALESLAQPAGSPASLVARGDVVNGRVQATTIPAYTYSVDPPVPDKPLPTLGTRLILVAHKDVPPRAAYRLVEATYAAEFGKIIRPPLDPKLLDLPPEFPWHDGTVLYQDRNSPLLSGEVMDSARQGLAIFAAAASGLFVLYQWAKMSGQRARVSGLGRFLAEATRLEQRVFAAEQARPVVPADLVALRDELNRLKAGALDELTQDELAGRELLTGFLVHVNDLRSHLTTLIHRHERGPE
jgi:TRAP-type uncharacterized transport system substrate-binding protein